MKHLFNLFLTEFSRIVLELSHVPVSFDQLSLFEEFAEINLVFNGFRVLHQYRTYLWELFMELRSHFDTHAYPVAELQRMLATAGACKLFYYRMEATKGKVWQHYHSYLPFDPGVSDFQKQLILCKLSRFYTIQKHFLQLVELLLKTRIELATLSPAPQPFEPEKPLKLPDCPTLLQWKGKKVYLAELAMGLYFSKSVAGRYGYLSLNEFQDVFCRFLGMDLGDFSAWTNSIYRRKKNYAVFFSAMQNKIEEVVMNQ